MGITANVIGIKDNKTVYEYVMTNSSDTRVVVLSLGAIIKSIYTKDKKGNYDDIVCGFDTPTGYIKAGGYFGAIVGRVANRLKNASFTIDGESYQLYANEGKHQLHGGKEGLNLKLWDADDGNGGDEPKLIMSYTSPDGEEGYPGTVKITVTYTLKKDGSLGISYRATTDKATYVTLTSHSYFNLGGFYSGKVDDYEITVDSDKIVECDHDLIPTGKLIDVTGTPYDLRKPKKLADGFASDDEMIRFLGGYDFCYLLKESDKEVRKVADLYDPNSGRYIEVETDQPCIQIYTGNMIEEDGYPFKGGVKQTKHCAVCLETEKMIDAPNHEGFSDISLRPGEVYTHETVYRFGVR